MSVTDIVTPTKDALTSVTDNEKGLSFTETASVSLKVRGLSIRAVSTSGLKRKFARKKEGKATQNQDAGEGHDVLGEKSILFDMSFDVPAGSVTAIMGGSGSGKTTLLNSMAGRQGKSNLVTEGTIMYNQSKNISSIRHAYVIQQDILLPQLTCFETLSYAAELRLPKLTKKEERHRLVDELILELGLKECRDTMVGDRIHKGLSGGEKRRLSIGIQLLANPSVLFLDEPTTGLDAYSALLLVQTLKKLAKKGKTFIVSIHQPRSDIFSLFDQILVLSRGRMCYGAKGSEIISYFSELGFNVPELVNPADYLVDITSIDFRTPEAYKRSSARYDVIAESWRARMMSTDDTPFADSAPNDLSAETFEPGRAPFLREVKILVRRNFVLTFRDPVGFAALIFECITLGSVCGWVFYRPGTSLSAIKTILGSLYITTSLQVYLLLLYETYRLCTVDMKVFDRERSEGCTTVWGFLLARRIAKLCCEDIIVPFIFSIITYFMFGLRTDSASHFFIFFVENFVGHLTSMSLATLAVAVSREVSTATLICNLNFTFQSMTNGFFVNAKDAPVYVRWCKYVAYVWYAFGCLSSNQFTGFKGSCFAENASNPDVDTICQAYSGSFVLDSIGFWENWIALPICVHLCWAIGFYVAAGVFLTLKPVDVSMAKEVGTKIKDTNLDLLSKDVEEEKAISRSTPEEIGITLRLQSLCLGVELKSPIRSLLRNSGQSKVILSDIDAVFKAGKMNAIMGPSGSGKSSLLNLISGRVNSNLTTRYSSSGSIYFNQYHVNTHVIRSLCSYVSQDDDNLLPSLSVEETLRFAATLRLSRSKMTRAEINELVDGFIRKMGLTECRNTPIGSEFVKGISGGEKRRVSIAIQLLNNPKILFLDEPTSGLDAFTASSILDVLRKLTEEGKTVIMTIHQPRFDLFNSFGSVLLLSKGGRVAFDGSPTEMLDHFGSLGYPVPALTNAADHVLDLISYNTQNEIAEANTRMRVSQLLNVWDQKKTQQKSLELTEQTTVVDDTYLMAEQFSTFVRKRAATLTAFKTLCRRQFLCVCRDMNLFMARIAQVTGMGVILALFFAPMKHNYNSIQNRIGILQQISSLYFVGVLNNVSVYPMERNFFYEEYEDNVVGSVSFFLAYLTCELPFEIFTALVFSVFVDMVVGLPRNPETFFALAYGALMTVNTGESLGIIFNTLVDHAGFALNVISLLASLATMMSGLMSLNMGAFLRGVNWVSPLCYVVKISTNLVFTSDVHFTCDNTTANADGTCTFSNGEDVLHSYGFHANVPLMCGLLAVVTVSYRLIAYGVLRIRLLRVSLDDFRAKVGLKS
ncbi:unnamed protein product [Kuraishia capsulata CBS 1993]|uniref:ABC transporter domain-containing protein n=1 Tax=Kuraishia capsulata CBS 1993 TaxID=1382522 RepID=W6MY44_9ASCO|nr:uncharacterized protein KUCA_T00005985001 [Kuraishia capsulata CBS 1993]CDK29990.1 unnamed protein product [Kuraishia capsulata CBS 1993]